MLEAMTVPRRLIADQSALNAGTAVWDKFLGRRMTMYAITGITGQVGGAVAGTLLAEGANVRAVARDVSKAAPWVEHG